MTIETKLPTIHPGEILDEEFLRPMKITQYRLAKTIGVDARRIHSIVHGERAITAETALLLAEQGSRKSYRSVWQAQREWHRPARQGAPLARPSVYRQRKGPHPPPPPPPENLGRGVGS